MRSPLRGSGKAMLIREHRKVNQIGTGGRSFVIRVPRSWADAVGVTDGSEVLVAFGLGDLLLVAPPGKEAEIDRLVEAIGGTG